MKKFFPILFLIAVIITGCETYEEEYNASQQTVMEMEQRIDSLKNTPAYMYGMAHDKIQNKNYDEAKKLLYELNREHPNWNQGLVIESINYVNKLQQPESNVMPNN